MPMDYEKIRTENRRRYGTDVGRWGDVLLADRYADRTHFIFELLQNAEDALARRTAEWQGDRSVRFELTRSELRIRHYGAPFNEKDVHGICGIDEGTKDLTAIGHFGIGFKSVYDVTDRPEVHSGSEDFAVEEYVHPFEVAPIERDRDETVFVLPFRSDDPEVFNRVLRGLQELDRTTLLFLREIEVIAWTVEGGSSGSYQRRTSDLEDFVRRIDLIGQEQEDGSLRHSWLVFSRTVSTSKGDRAGFAEIAFSTEQNPGSSDDTLKPVETSPLVVYFPTVVETHLGFLIQGPYRTTPSRDNVPHEASWNEHVMDETASLLTEALRWLRNHGRLDLPALRCLPLDRSTFAEAQGGMFKPLFDTVRQALSSQPLLPRHGGGYVAADDALLARTRELRDLLNPRQLSILFGQGQERWWITDRITRDRTPVLRRYLTEELGVREISPDTLVSEIDDEIFLEAQSDRWVRDLYHFLSDKRALRKKVRSLPLIRLKDGSHVVPSSSGQQQAYLPAAADTDFPTVRPSVCDTDTAREFLESLGVAEPDPVDDILRNVLPKYEDQNPAIDEQEYEEDIARILTAYETDSKKQRKKLVDALAKAPFVPAVDGTGDSVGYTRPGGVYIATDRLRRLFRGVNSVRLVDHRKTCLRGKAIRLALQETGAVSYIKPVQLSGPKLLSPEQRRELRREAGHAETSGQNDEVFDWKLKGLEEILDLLPELDADERRTRAKLLWEELGHLEDRRGEAVFQGTYKWTHYGEFEKSFDAAFVRRLNRTPWIPDESGVLHRPDALLFDDLEWPDHSFLRSKIEFKHPVVDQLAEKAGIEVGVLDVLKEAGVTSEDQLRNLLDLGNGTETTKGQPAAGTDVKHPKNEDPTPETGGHPASTGPSETQGQGKQRGDNGRSGQGVDGGSTGGETEDSRDPADSPSNMSSGHEFVSYVGVHPTESAHDAEGRTLAERMELENKAIELILSQEPTWHRTAPGNPGFDLYRTNEYGKTNEWCEVKAMTGGLKNHPVGLSKTQFDWARKYGTSYWLYVVERTGTDDARIVRVQDPAGKAQTFTFDRGWLKVAKVDKTNRRDKT